MSVLGLACMGCECECFGFAFDIKQIGGLIIGLFCGLSDRPVLLFHILSPFDPLSLLLLLIR